MIAGRASALAALLGIMRVASIWLIVWLLPAWSVIVWLEAL